MHVPSVFKEDNPEVLLKIMNDNAFATLVTTDENNLPVATQLPFLIKKNEKGIKLLAHFAKNNPQWEHLNSKKPVLVIFNGPHCYISPSWYQKSGVPTWNYVTIHAYGTPTIFNGNTKTEKLVEELSDHYEILQENPWKATDNYSKTMLNAIIGFEITVQELQGKVKIGQNKTQSDLQSVLTILEKSSSEQERAIALLIKNYLESKD